MVEDIFVYCDTHFQLYKHQQKKLYVSPYDSTAWVSSLYIIEKELSFKVLSG